MELQMIIKKIAVGNQNEAYIENSLSDGFNIILSDDNNKGKTIIIQSLMFALGNEPTFPASFDYKKYYHYVDFIERNTEYSICRHVDNYILKYNSKLYLFNCTSELKRFWTKNIFDLPEIQKKGNVRVVDPVLFHQLFFIGQDKKDTSNVANTTYYKKDDFYNMLYNITGISGNEISAEEVKDLSIIKKSLERDKENILKKNKLLKSRFEELGYVSPLIDRNIFEQKYKELKKVQSNILEYKKSRNKSLNLKMLWGNTKEELNSLNRTLDCGELRCMNCNSTNIGFSQTKKNSFVFDVSTVEIRSNIIKSIDEKIETFSEDIEKYTALINCEQEKIKNLVNTDDINIENIVLYKDELSEINEPEKSIKEINIKIDEIKNLMKSNIEASKENKQKQIELIEKIHSLLKNNYQDIINNGTFLSEGLFTNSKQIYSGSEATVFHLSKIYSLYKVLNHNYPIIVDSYRAEDLSTINESHVLSLFNSINNQKIFTTTLKDEEIGKYKKNVNINCIDYSNHQSCKMLSSSFNSKFKIIMESLNVKI